MIIEHTNSKEGPEVNKKHRLVDVSRLMAAMLIAAAVPSLVHAQTNRRASTYSIKLGRDALEVCAASLQPGDASQFGVLGDIFWHGQDPVVPQDRQRAITVYKRGAELGDSESQIKLSYALKTTGAPPQAWIAALEKAAMQGHKQAIKRLSDPDWRIEKSEDPKDREIREAFQQSMVRVASTAKLDDELFAQLAAMIGWTYQAGYGTVPSPSLALNWYTRAGERGADKALWEAVKMYKQGLGVPQDHQEAEKLLTTFLRRNQAFFEGNPQPYLRWLEQAANLGFSSAAFRLSEIYTKGLSGVPANSERASFWKSKGLAAQATERS
jgi:TPR repeat protein